MLTLTVVYYFFMLEGKIKYISDKGFGFIANESYPKDLFFHVKDVIGGTSMEELRVGDSVNFEAQQTEKGMAAKNVQLV